MGAANEPSPTLLGLPDEVLLQVLSYLEPNELVSPQLVCRRLFVVCRDNSLWKRLCFEHSVAERRRRRQLATVQDPRLAEIVEAADSIAAAFMRAVDDPATLVPEAYARGSTPRVPRSSLANWDPTYPGEKANFYDEYIQRHAPASIDWFQSASHGHEDDKLHFEATGAGILFDDHGMADKLVAPLEDGSISMWDAAWSGGSQGAIVARSSMGLLANRGADLDYNTRLRQSQTIMTETGAVECVSIDSRQRKGYFAVQNVLNEVDLSTLKVVSRTPYPFPITALSEARHPTPLTVGTNWTVHLHDTRKPPSLPAVARSELIGGDTSNSYSRLETGDFGGHVSLSQPGALSILHLPTTRGWDNEGDIWVGGRFTSMLSFDRRYFPRLRGTVHSGARLSCLAALPYHYLPHEIRPTDGQSSSLPSRTRALPGYTLVAAGEYKGKGSLELYSLSSQPNYNVACSKPQAGLKDYRLYQNRQTASSSKLLSAAPHGTRLALSDGDGNLKWVERDGTTLVRKFNINDEELRERPSEPAHIPHPNSSANFESEEVKADDIVQKILPTVSRSLNDWNYNEVPLGQDNLIIWTGDGKLGMVGFGKSEDVFVDALEEAAQEEEGRVLRNKERQYGAEMRRALEHQARELRWLRGYGLG